MSEPTCDDVTTSVYRDAAGREIRVVCPWGDHSGNVPPPVIEFSTGWFAFQGSTVKPAAEGDDE